MATLNEIHDAIADVVNDVDGVRCSAWPEEGVTPPFAFPSVETWTQETFTRRSGVFRFQLQLVVITAKGARSRDGYRALMDLVDPTNLDGIRVAIYDANQNTSGFGGLASTEVFVEGLDDVGQIVVDGVDMYGGVLTLQVATKGP